MKNNNLRIVFSILLTVLFTTVLFAQPTPPSGKSWKRVNALSDEFNSLDGNKWKKNSHVNWKGRSPSQFNPNNVSVSNGKLKIKGTPKDPNVGRIGDRIWTGILRSDKASFKPGMYAEASVKNADMTIVSSFWMQGRFSEIDVIENWGTVKNQRWKNLETTMEMNTHYFPQPCGFDCDRTTQKHFNDGTRNADNFNVYGVWWKDTRTILWYKNPKNRANPVAEVRLPYNFNEGMWMYFDMEAFTWGPGVADNNELNNNNRNTAQYDWVHTYELVNGGGGSDPDPDPTGNDNAFYIVNRQTQKKIRPQNSADASKIIQVASNATDNNVKWEQVNTSGGYFYLKNVQTGKYFRPAGDNDGSDLEQRPTSYSGNYTQWKKINTSNGFFYLQNRQTGMYFRPTGDNNNDKMIQRPTSYGGNYTQWKFQNASSKSAGIATLDFKLQAIGNTLKINLEKAGAVSVNVYDLGGNNVYNDSFISNTSEISIPFRKGVGLATGVYIAKVISNDQVKTVKFAIK